MVARVGNGVLAPDGEIDRGALATIVFNDRDALAWLEELLHPLVLARVPAVARATSRELPNAPRVCVTEVPLLYEIGGETRFDKVVVITAPTKLRRARSERRDRGARERGCCRTREKVTARRLRLQEHRLARGAGRVRRVGDATSCSRVRRTVLLSLLVLLAGDRRIRPLRHADDARRGTSASAIRCATRSTCACTPPSTASIRRSSPP